MNVLVTGANGLLGKALCNHLESRGFRVLRAVRAIHVVRSEGEVAIGEVDGHTDWTEALVRLTAPVRGGNLQDTAGGHTHLNQPPPLAEPAVVIHLVAKIPAPGGPDDEPDDDYHRINTLGTANLARQCAAHGVRRFIFLSTIKVNGEGRDTPYRSTDTPQPENPYACTKLEAEEQLRAIGAQAGMETVILRPPMVYGPGVKGNFLALMKTVDRGTWLPLGAVNNRRSLLYLDNLVDVITHCIAHPAAAGHTFLVSDGDDVSTPELIRRVAQALGRKPALIPVPVDLMKFGGVVLGKQGTVRRLTGSLAIDNGDLQSLLQWTPPHRMNQGLAETVQWYRQHAMENRPITKTSEP